MLAALNDKREIRAAYKRLTNRLREGAEEFMMTGEGDVR